MLDTKNIARFAERHLMPDQVRVTRPSGEDVLDPLTGELRAGEERVVYDGKAGLYRGQERIRSRSGHDGAWAEEVRPGYRMLLPVDAPEVAEADTVHVVAARDQHAVGRLYDVMAMGEVSSFPVVRTVWLEEHNRTAATG
ncbi:DUF6093 family protein [Streptomyces abikoensis]|uniref:DUF6093 family protein n=1 Tax=Streptomyces abikoensis TaxID=97398 RepID=A0ABW7T4R3_9ACTN